MTGKAPIRIFVCLFALIVLALVPPASLAGDPQGDPRGPGGRGMHAERLFERLDLTPDQQEQVRGILSQHRETMRDQMHQLRAARAALDEQIHAGEFDETAIRQKADAVSAIDVELAVARGALLSELRQVLTPDQLAEFEELQELRRSFIERPRGRRGPAPRQGDAGETR